MRASQLQLAAAQTDAAAEGSGEPCSPSAGAMALHPDAGHALDLAYGVCIKARPAARTAGLSSSRRGKLLLRMLGAVLESAAEVMDEMPW